MTIIVTWKIDIYICLGVFWAVHGCFRAISWVVQGYFKIISRVFKCDSGVYNEIFEPFPKLPKTVYYPMLTKITEY